MQSIKTLAELKETTKTFDYYTTIMESRLPDYYKTIFPKKCKCGAEIIISTGGDGSTEFAQLQCCDPHCRIKKAHQFVYFLKSLGFKGIGSANALPLFEIYQQYFKTNSFLEIFELSYEQIFAICGDSVATNIINIKDELQNSAWSFKDVIVALGIPDLGDGSKLFTLIKSPDIMRYTIEQDKIADACDVVGINAPKSIYYLRTFSGDILYLLDNITPNIKATPKQELCVAITGSVSVNGEYLTRLQFIQKCESLTDSHGTPMFKLIETKAESRLQCVIADAPSSSSKYRIGERLGILITAQDFYDTLCSNIKG